jgi:hypothetical protein
MAVDERRSVLDGRDMHMKSENDVRALLDLYSDVPDALMTPGDLIRGHRRNASDSALLNFSPTPDYLPPGYYKSHGYENNFTSYLDTDLLTRASRDLDFHSSLLGDRMGSSLLHDYDGEGIFFTDCSAYNNKGKCIYIAEPPAPTRRRRSDGSIDLENLSYALDSYGRPVLCEYDLKERQFQRRKNPSKLKSALTLDDDLLTREEKAARIRAEIARRREQLINSELESRYARSLDDRDLYLENAAVYADDFDESYDDMLDDYEEEFYDPLDPSGVIHTARLRSGPAFISRSLDNGIDDYAMDEYGYAEDVHSRHAAHRGERHSLFSAGLRIC